MRLTGGSTGSRERLKEPLSQCRLRQVGEIGPDCYHYIVAGRDCLPVLACQLDQAPPQLIAFDGFVGDFLRYDDDQPRVGEAVWPRLDLQAIGGTVAALAIDPLDVAFAAQTKLTR